MSDQYMKELLRIAVAQICQTIGYNATQTAPLELLQDVLDKFMREFTRDLRRQVEHYNRTEANLNDVNLTLRSINVNLNELLDYINNVEPVPFALELPKFPARKDSSLNFLKPGSKEVLTRPVHVHDHLPPMLPPEIIQSFEQPVSCSSNNLSDIKSFQDNLAGNSNYTNGEQNNDSANKSLNASTVLDKTTLQSLFKPSANFEDGERPTREVSSVVMTTGGYISPAVEGKMPEAIVPDIIDKLLGLDAPPPPPPPPPPSPPPQSRPASRSANFTAGPVANENLIAAVEDVLPEREFIPSTNKETKKSLTRNLEPQPIPNKKLELLQDFQAKKHKLFNPSGKIFPHDPHIQPVGNYNKKSFMMHQNAANMLLKKAKKQKLPLMPGQSGLNEKHNKPLNEKLNKIDAADKAHRKYMKMLQKMAKQGKIPPELLSNIMGPEKKSKMINPSIVASMPPGPEKLQLEKLLRKQAKQRQKLQKQQMIIDTQKQTKKTLQLPPLVPIFPSRMAETLSKPLQSELEEHKLNIQNKDLSNKSPVKSAFTSNIVTPTTSNNPNHSVENFLNKANKIPVLPENHLIDMDSNAKSLTTQDVKEHKLSNEPDRSKLNIFKKISKQKTPKSSSPTPMRLTGINDTPVINLPSGTTITPAPNPSKPSNSSSSLITTPIGRNLFPTLLDNNSGGVSGNIINIEDIKDNPLQPPINSNQPTDLRLINRVFGEKPPEVELVNKPKKRGRKPGSKNSPKIPGVFPNNLLKKNSKKIKMDNSNIFGPQLPPQIPPEFAAVAANVAQFFGNHINPIEWAQNKHLHQQMMIMASAKERKEHKKKNKLLKQDILSNDNNIITNMSGLTNPQITLPSNEEVQSINKKLMRMDTILKATTSSGMSSTSSTTDLTVDTSLMIGKKLPSPSIFPSSTSPLKSPGNSKRLIAANSDAIANSLVQPFMLPNRPTFPNLPGNMLSMLQFPFPPRPGLIPTPGLFPTPGLVAFPNNPKNPLLPGLFPFPNLKQPMADTTSINHESENLSTENKKSEVQSIERSYCNVAPLVPDFLTKLNDPNVNSSSSKNFNEPHHVHEPDLPKTPKPRNSHSNNLSQDNLLKKIVDAHTPESAGGSLSGKSIPSTPGGISLNTFEQLMKKNDSPIDLMPLNKHSKSMSGSQESGLDFSMHKKQTHNTNIGGMGGGGASAGGLIVKTPITLNNEPIEVSDDSDETNQPPPPPPEKRAPHVPPQVLAHQNSLAPPAHHSNFNMDEMFVANTNPHMIPKSLETDLSTKELKKLKKQVKKSSSNINANLLNTNKAESLTAGSASTGGVGKLAGGADLIPLTSTGLAYSAKNIPYNSLTANANPSFNVHKTEFSNTVSASSTAPTPSTSSVFNNLTITATNPLSSGTSSNNTVIDLQKKRKEHKKLKKLKELKEGKIKKKKDKKDKSKSKEKAEKYLLSHPQISPSKDKIKEPLTVIGSLDKMPSTLVDHSSSGTEKIKDKDLLKRLKKEKKKEKQRNVLEELSPQNPSNMQQATASNPCSQKITTPSSISTATIEVEPPKKQKLSPALNYSSTSRNEHATPITINTTPPPPVSIVPKLTLKLGSTHSPTPPRDDGHKNSSTSSSMAVLASVAPVQHPPPPATNITPTREREPSPELARISPLVTRPPKHKLSTSGDLATSTSSTSNSISAANASSLEIGDNSKNSLTSNPSMIVPPPSPWLSGGTISASSVLLPHQLLQTTKQHDMTSTPSSAAHNIDNNSKNSNTDRQSPLTLITETSRPSSYIDAEGNRVWICPACGKVDDGSPMIGCDGCDAWYHWVCVGIFVAPKDNEDWFCRVCITRKKGLHASDKKRKRNKKK